MNPAPPPLRACAAGIRLVALDVDGVLTDGSLLYTDQGETLKSFHVRDGMGIRLLRENGVKVAVITARHSGPLERRMKDLNIDAFFPACEQKLATLSALTRQIGIEFAQVAFMGDDVIDLPVLRRVGLAATVSDGHHLVKQEAHWISRLPGGRGAVRELADLVLEHLDLGVARGLTERVETFLAPRSQTSEPERS